jgi:hypothetical protein
MKILLTAAITLLASLAFGQSKTQQVADAMGTRIREIPTAQDKITFAFDEGGKERYYNRTGNGRDPYPALLKATGGIIRFNDQGGRLISITKNGDVIARGPEVEVVNRAPVGNRNAVYITPSETGDPVRPRTLPTSQEIGSMARTDEPVGYTVPDSVTIAETVTRTKYEIWKIGETAKAAARPWWELVMWFLWYVFAFVVIVAGVLWFAAWVFAREGMYTAHKACRRSLAYIAVGAGAIVLINCLLFAASFGLHPIVLVLIAGAEVRLAAWAVTIIVPDFKPAAGNAPIVRRGNSGMTPYEQ